MNKNKLKLLLMILFKHYQNQQENNLSNKIIKVRMNSIDKKVEVLKKVKKGIIAKIIIIKKKIKMREIMNHKVVLANIIILQSNIHNYSY